MRDQFVPYELSVKLKELGLDEPCLAGYYNDGKSLWFFRFHKNSEREPTVAERFATAPLWHQAFDFLLKKHNLYGIIIPTVTMHWTFKTMTVVEGIVEVPPYKHVDSNDYSSVEEARQACLEKLIELVQK